MFWALKPALRAISGWGEQQALHGIMRCAKRCVIFSRAGGFHPRDIDRVFCFFYPVFSTSLAGLTLNGAGRRFYDVMAISGTFCTAGVLLIVLSIYGAIRGAFICYRRDHFPQPGLQSAH